MLRTSLWLGRNGSRAPVRVSQSCTPLGLNVPAASILPLWLNATALTKWASGARAPPNPRWGRRFHSRTVRSVLPDASRWPDGLKATLVTTPV